MSRSGYIAKLLKGDLFNKIAGVAADDGAHSSKVDLLRYQNCDRRTRCRAQGRPEHYDYRFPLSRGAEPYGSRRAWLRRELINEPCACLPNWSNLPRARQLTDLPGRPASR